MYLYCLYCIRAKCQYSLPWGPFFASDVGVSVNSLPWGIGNMSKSRLRYQPSMSISRGLPPPPPPTLGLNIDRCIRQETLQCLSPLRCINGYRRHNAGGNLAMDQHSIQEEIAIIFLVALFYKNRVKLQPRSHLWLVWATYGSFATFPRL